MVMGQGLHLIGFYCFPKERQECEVGVVPRRDGLLIESCWCDSSECCFEVEGKGLLPCTLEGVCGTEQNALGSLEYFSENSYLKLNPTYLN